MLANLRALFGVVVDIVFLRRGPENMPASNTLLGIVVVVYVALYALVYGIYILPVAPATSNSWALQIVCLVLSQLAWFRIAFQLVGKPERFTQTVTAMFAISVLFLPSVAMLPSLIPYMQKGATGQPPALTTFLAAFIEFWMFVIMVRIVRSAFEWTWLRSIFFFLASKIVAVIILALVFGDSQKPV